MQCWRHTTTFFSPPDPPMHSISMHFTTMGAAAFGRRPPLGGGAPRRIIVVKCIEIECVGGSGGLKNVIVCLQHYMGGKIAPPCERAQGVSISYLIQYYNN